jgi:hypothetical protein
LGLGVVVLISGPVRGAEPAGADVQAVVAKIDQLLGARWAEAKVEPAPVASDAEFLRRVYLDVAGRIPSVAEARSFLEDKRPDKRALLVDQLLAGSSYVAHMTNVWRALLLPEAGNNFQVRLQQGSFDNWLKKQVAKNVGYDKLARELLTAPVGNSGGLAGIAGLLGNSGPLTYYLAKEFKPENLASNTARVFLGVSVGCAECHNHPFAEWKREQFWGLAAFYSGITSQRQMDFLLPGREDARKHEITMPGTEKVIQAKFLDGTEPTWNAKPASRTALADWLTAPSNPYFAPAAVNRAWAYYLGTGLVEPIDEMVGASSTAHQPAVLDLLSKEFRDHQYDMKFLIRVITSTRAYQLSSAAKTKATDDEKGLFVRMPLRGLSAEQLFDNVAMATGYRDSGGGDDLISGLLGGNRSARSEFLTKFAQSDRATETQTSILQALTLMNGKVIANATALERSETLAAVVDAPFLSTAERVETLYLATLSRKPQQKELDRAVRFLEDAAKGKDKEAAGSNGLADLFWALLNSTEFILNH